MTTPEDPADKPRLRGKIHAAGALLAIPPLIWLALQAQPGPLRVGAIVYGLSLVGLLATSGSYHVPSWSPEIKARMRRLDRSMIFVLIAGSYTPLMIATGPTAQEVYLPLIWVLAGLGVLRTMSLPNAPIWVTALSYVVMGWLAAPLMPQWIDVLGIEVLGLVMTSGIIYTLGAVVYVKKRPNPWPKIFGYHEIFHVAVILGAACHGWAVWRVVV
jgi:hemolysin III